MEAVYESIPSLIWSFLRRTFINLGIANGFCHNKVAYATRTTSQQTMLAGEKLETFYHLSCNLPVYDLFGIFFQHLLHVFQHLLHVSQSFCQVLDSSTLALILNLQLVNPLWIILDSTTESMADSTSMYGSLCLNKTWWFSSTLITWYSLICPDVLRASCYSFSILSLVWLSCHLTYMLSDFTMLSDYLPVMPYRAILEWYNVSIVYSFYAFIITSLWHMRYVFFCSSVLLFFCSIVRLCI